MKQKSKCKRIKKIVLQRDGKKCVKCGTVHSLTLDHIIPKFYGGRTCINNSQILCLKCNSEKGIHIYCYTSDMNVINYLRTFEQNTPYHKVNYINQQRT